MLVQNATTKEKAAWAKFGDETGRSTMTLHSGHYALRYKICNWNQPTFSPVTIAIEDANGNEVASQVYTPTVNIGNSTANKFSSALQTFEFEIPETGNYVITFYADAAKNADFVLGQVSLQAKSYVTSGIHDIQSQSDAASTPRKSGCYDLSGRRLSKESLNPGLYIIDGRQIVIK